MPNCLRCGSETDSVSGVCNICEASSGHGIGTPTDVPCQRCGMYLPPHELKMWNSRLYCSYCIMDIQDDERRASHAARKKPDSDYGAGAGESLPQEGGDVPGTCEKCLKQFQTLYSLNGRRLCARCYNEEGGASGSPSSFIAQLVIVIKGAVGLSPKIVPKESTQRQQPAARPAVHQEEQAQQRSEVFDIRNRQMQDKKSGMEAQHPISEERHEEKKPSPQAKKFFFGLHPSEKKKEG